MKELLQDEFTEQEVLTCQPFFFPPSCLLPSSLPSSFSLPSFLFLSFSSLLSFSLFHPGKRVPSTPPLASLSVAGSVEAAGWRWKDPQPLDPRITQYLSLSRTPSLGNTSGWLVLNLSYLNLQIFPSSVGVRKGASGEPRQQPKDDDA